MRVIVADDERFVRQGIVSEIQWNLLGVDEVLEARNGEACLQMMQTRPADILIADIRMPKLDGVALGRRVMERYPGCRIIFISAYTDKEYFKSAIGLNVVAYVEKPIAMPELVAAIEKAVAQVRAQRNHADAARLSQVFRAMLTGGAVPSECGELLRQRANYSYCVSLIRVRSEDNDAEALDAEGLKAAFRQRNMEAYLFGDVFRLEYVALAESAAGGRLEESCRQVLRQYALDHGEERFFASVGETGGGIYGICESFRSASRGLECRFFMGSGILSTGPAEGGQRVDYELPESLCGTLRYSIVNRVGADFEGALDELCGALAKGRYTEKSARIAAIRIMNLFCTLGLREQTEPQDIDYVMHCDTLQDVRTFLCARYADVFRFGCVTDEYVLGAMRLIAQEYGNSELSIGYICRRLGVSKSKICSLFRRETGKSINEYINECRMMAAKEFVQEGAPIKEVAKMTGFNDLNYFSKAFKRYTGKSPRTYKEQDG